MEAGQRVGVALLEFPPQGGKTAGLVLQPLRTARWTLTALAAGLGALMLVATSTYASTPSL